MSCFPSETSSSRCVTWHSSSWISPPAACFLIRCVQLLFLWVGLWDKLLLTLITALKKETLHADNTRGRLMTRSTPQEAAVASDPAVLIKDFLPDISLWRAWITASDASIFIYKSSIMLLNRESFFSVFLICPCVGGLNHRMTFLSPGWTSGWDDIMFRSLLRASGRSTRLVLINSHHKTRHMLRHTECYSQIVTTYNNTGDAMLLPRCSSSSGRF